jgi:hypothetical protein
VLAKQESVSVFQDQASSSIVEEAYRLWREQHQDFNGECATKSPYSRNGSTDWITICNNLQVSLVSSCDVLVNSDNTLTQEGERAVGRIRNGIPLSGGGSFLANLALPLIIAALQVFEHTGCDGIVDWGSIGNAGDLREVIEILT